MKNVIKAIVFILVLLPGVISAQPTSEKLKHEQQQLEQQIANTKMLLAKSQSNVEASLNDLKVIENQISYRERLLKNYDNQIRAGELTVQKKELQIQKMTERVDKLREQYKKLLLYAYKHRNKYGKMMYIFSSDNYYEAVKRNKYLQRISEIQKQQFIVIKQHQDLIKKEIASIEVEKKNKQAVIAEKKAERAAIEKDKILAAEIYQKFKAEEETILAELRKKQKDRELLQARVQQAIQREIAEAEARARAEAERKRKEEEARKASGTGTNTTAEKPETTVFESTAESAALSKSFEGNRGKLPWPVEKGTITENFGKNPHPTLKNVYTNNRGIDISAPQNAQVRAVFEGEVTSVLNIPGAGKVIIIKHGNYRTVYSNLQDTYVKKGQKVTTKMIVGSLLTKDAASIAHFEIHKVEGSAVTCLNPSLWVAR